MKRREFTALLGGAATWPLTARAQQSGRVARVGALVNFESEDAQGRARLSAFEQGLQQLGWTIGGSVRIDYRWGGGDADRTRQLAAELVASAPDVILAGGNQSVAALQQATHAVPIVFAGVVDPVGSGFVESLVRPGANITGVTLFEYSISGRWLELLKEIAPGVTRAAIVRDESSAEGGGQWGVIQAMAPSVGVDIIPVNMHDAAEIERRIVALADPRMAG